MKKIMFDDRYFLTKAVLEGRKTMTRRVIPQLLNVKDPEISQWGMSNKGLAHITLYKDGRCLTDIFPAYQPGETVAIAQRYSELSWDKAFYDRLCSMCDREQFELPQYKFAGWDNKMFVKADLMPHRIVVTDVKVEPLQAISDGDCLREGITCGKFNDFPNPMYFPYPDCPDGEVAYYPETAFKTLIDRISGKGTWERNPWVFAYTFKLIS